MVRSKLGKSILYLFVIFVLVILCAFMFAEPLAKIAIEKGTSQYTGAEVNVEDVNLSYIPFTVTISKMQATDPKRPSHNMAEVEQATASLSLWQYLMGNTIIEELTIERLAMQTARSEPGDVYILVDEQGANFLADDWLESLEQSLPTPESLLENSNLKTVKRAKAFEQSYQQESEKINQIKSKLPSKERLKKYQDQVKALTESKVNNLEDITRIKKEFDELKVAFKKEKAAIVAAKQQVISSKDTLSSQLEALKNAPAEDWQDIEHKYQLDKIEAEDFAHIIFGEKAREYYQIAEIVWQQLAPMLAQEGSGSGDIEEGVTPTNSDALNFLLKKGHISIVLPQGTYVLDLKDITHQHWLVGHASEIALKSTSDVKGDVNLAASFELNRLKELAADGKWGIDALPLDNVLLKDDDTLSLSLVKSLLSGQGKFGVDANELSFLSDFTLNDADFTGKASSKLGNTVVDTLSALSSLALSLSADGPVSHPNWSISSPLNNMFSAAFKQQIAAKLGDYKGKLQSGLNDKLGNSVNMGDAQLAELLDIEAFLNDSDGAFESLMKNDIVKAKQKELENKAKDKLKKKLGKLFG